MITLCTLESIYQIVPTCTCTSCIICIIQLGVYKCLYMYMYMYMYIFRCTCTIYMYMCMLHIHCTCMYVGCSYTYTCIYMYVCVLDAPGAGPVLQTSQRWHEVQLCPAEGLQPAGQSTEAVQGLSAAHQCSVQPGPRAGSQPLQGTVSLLLGLVPV